MRFNPLVAAAVGLLAIASVPALVEHAEHGRGEASEAHRSYQSSPSLQPGSAISNPTNNEPRTDLGEAKNPSDSQEQGDSSSSVWTNWIQAVCAVAIVVFTGFLWLVQERQTGLTESALKVSTEAANHAANAAKAAVDQHRAWVKVSDLRINWLWFRTDGNEPSISADISVKIQNVGATPATQIRWDTAVWAIPFTEGNIDRWADFWNSASSAFEARASGYGFVLFPNDEPLELTHTSSTSVWPVAGSLEVDPTSDETIRLFGVATVLYKIASGDSGKTTVPFLILLKETLAPNFKEMARNKRKRDDIGAMRLGGAERAT